jgi:hypothetical protein
VIDSISIAVRCLASPLFSVTSSTPPRAAHPSPAGALSDVFAFGIPGMLAMSFLMGSGMLKCPAGPLPPVDPMGINSGLPAVPSV